MGTQNRGFASMDRDKQRRIARLGGIAVQQKGNGHKFTTEEAKAAGRKGGLASAAARYSNRTEADLIERVSGIAE
jgi:general stress protein YciG